ncbi:MAG: 3-isopropylmalate dehydratase small subunit [Anaerolineae bacterium]|jgi:3-isopropylmalate/(R)-2-methylmalate dehydratase small subunit
MANREETEVIEGKAWTCGDNVDTDAIIPARYLNLSTEKGLAPHCMEDLDPTFAARAMSGDGGPLVIVAGENFGCGSSREHAPLAIKGAGVSCVVARSFARIFYRNAINIGLPILTCTEAVEDTSAGDRLRIDLRAGTITNLGAERTYETHPLPGFIMDIIAAGGLVPSTIERGS